MCVRRSSAHLVVQMSDVPAPSLEEVVANDVSARRFGNLAFSRRKSADREPKSGLHAPVGSGHPPRVWRGVDKDSGFGKPRSSFFLVGGRLDLRLRFRGCEFWEGEQVSEMVDRVVWLRRRDRLTEERLPLDICWRPVGDADQRVPKAWVVDGAVA